jgi:hypothetical protein
MDYRAGIVTQGVTAYGIASEGAGSVMKYVVASIYGHGAKVIASAAGDVPHEAVEKLAKSHVAMARSAAVRDIHTRHIDDVLAYVRSLPRGSRSEHLFSQDPDVVETAEVAVADALAKALGERDSFRASMVFDQQTPFLRSDRRVVDLMDGIAADFEMRWNSGEARYMGYVADMMEARMVERAPMLAAKVERAKSCASAENNALAV